MFILTDTLNSASAQSTFISSLKFRQAIKEDNRKIYILGEAHSLTQVYKRDNMLRATEIKK